MPSIRHILVPVDFSECSRAAFAFGAELARVMTARLTALHVHPYPVPANEWALVTSEPPGAEVLVQLESDLRQWVTPPGADCPLADTVVWEGEAAGRILAHAASHDVDLIVMGQHGRGVIEHWMTGSVAERVARKATCPVLVIPPRVAAPACARVLCALDLGPTAAGTLEYAAMLTRFSGGRLVVWHAVELARGYEPWTVPGVDRETVQRALAAPIKRCLAALVAEHAPGMPAEIRVAFGHAKDALGQAVSGADVAIVGASSHSAVHQLLFGSTAEHLLRAGVCPVLFVRHAARPVGVERADTVGAGSSA